MNTNKYPIVRVHRNTYTQIAKFCEQTKRKMPDAIGMMVEYFLQQETNIDLETSLTNAKAKGEE